jgi:CBS domain-containing protein
MRIERVYTRRVLATTRSAHVTEAAAAMREFGVGALLVMDEANPTGKPVGFVTDRDLALNSLNPGSDSVGSVMTPIVATIRHGADSHEALETMRAHGVRRLAVTSDDGAVCGMLSIDDVVDGLSVDLASAAAVLKGEIKHDSAGLGDVKIGG